MLTREKRSWLAMLAGVAMAAVLGMPAKAHADCMQALGMLQAQLKLIEAAAPLVDDRNAALQPAQTLHHKISEALTERTKLASGGLAGKSPRPADKSAYEKALMEANAAVAQARQALIRGDEAGCQEAISQGLDAVRHARVSL